MEYVVTLNGNMIATAFDDFDEAKALANEHIAAGTDAEIAVDCYRNAMTTPVYTVRYDSVGKKWAE
jgi:hypothetical protein